MQHIILTLDVGTREIERSTSTYTEVYKYLKKRVCTAHIYISNIANFVIASYS